MRMIDHLPRTKIDGIEMTALLVTSSSVSSYQAGAVNSLNGDRDTNVTLRDHQKGANSIKTPVIGIATLSVKGEAESHEIRVLIVPGLQS